MLKKLKPLKEILIANLKNNKIFLFGVLYLLIFFIGGIGMVGKTSENCFDPFTLGDVMSATCFQGSLFALGIIAGRNSKK